MKRARTIVALALLAAAALWWWRPAPDVQTGDLAPVEAVRRAPKQVAIEEPARASPPSNVPTRQRLAEDNAPMSARTELPRPAQRTGAPAPFQLSKEKGLRDQREGTLPGAARELETLRYGLDTLHEDVEDCLEAWSSKSATISGSVRIALQVDANGLTKAWLIGGDRVPFGPRTCLGNAAYGIDWSNIVDHPAEITDDFELAPIQED